MFKLGRQAKKEKKDQEEMERPLASSPHGTSRLGERRGRSLLCVPPALGVGVQKLERPEMSRTWLFLPHGTESLLEVHVTCINTNHAVAFLPQLPSEFLVYLQHPSLCKTHSEWPVRMVWALLSIP